MHRDLRTEPGESQHFLNTKRKSFKRPNQSPLVTEKAGVGEGGAGD